MTREEAKGFIQGKLDCMDRCDVFDCKGTDECENCNYCYSQGNFGEQKKAFEMAIESLEKQIPIKFDNACNCIFNEEVLFNAIDLECRIRNCYRQSEYKIYLHNDYPCISLGHEKVRIHNLIGKWMYGNIRKGYVIHHRDHNKLNALESNLDYLSNNAHTKLHMQGKDFRSEEGKWKGINSAREKRYRKEITKEGIEELISQGKSKQEIAKHYQCGIQTINRRLGYKCKALDWTEEGE